jgi:hypothetical protein
VTQAARVVPLVTPPRRCGTCGLIEGAVAFRSVRVRRCTGCEQAALVRLPPRRPAVDEYEGRDLGNRPPPELYVAALLIARHAGASPRAVLSAWHFPELYHRARRRLLPWFGGDPQLYAELKAAGDLLARALRHPDGEVP